MKPTLVHFPPEVIAQLDARAARDEVSRSQLVRQAVAAFLSVEARSELATRVARAYERQPLSTPDEWGDLESFVDAVREARTGGS